MSLRLLIVTSLVVGFLGFALELFCDFFCNLAVIVNKVNYSLLYTVVLLDRIVVASEAIVICLLKSWRGVTLVKKSI